MKSNEPRSWTIPPVNTESRSNMSHYDNSMRSVSIDDWNCIYSQQMDASLSNNMYDVCECCKKPDCDNVNNVNRLIRKLEFDTRLAAEIGQGLLEQREFIEKQVEEYQERIHLLEQSLDKVENSKSNITKEKNKWFWECQKRQKILDETVSDLELANEKCCQLSKELISKSSELEKLRFCKFMARHSESREEALSTKLEDTNQELAICRKHELILESKIKKLTTKYENLCNSHEKMLQDFQDQMNTTTTYKKTPINHVSYSDTNDFIDLIKELSLANTKLKLDLMNCKDQLSDQQVQVIALTQKMEDLNETSIDTTSVKEIYKSITSTSLPTSSAILSESSHSNIKDDPSSPFVMLQEHITHVIDRIRGSDIRALNRRLKRAFDIKELSMMSNSIIENILMDADTLDSRFLWVSQDNDDFFPILDLFKNLLNQVGVLTTTLNDLQVEYVKKIEENQVRVEDEIIKKRQLKQQQQVVVQPTTNLFSWITNLFYYKPSEPDHLHDTTSSIITGTTSSSEISHPYYDKNSTTTASTNSIVSPDEEETTRIIRYQHVKRLQKPYFPPLSSSLGSNRSTLPSIPIRKRGTQRVHFDYEGMGPAAIRPIPPDITTHFSSSWLGGK